MSDETQEPTLRNGDDTVDGWVEYAKSLLLETAVLHDVAIDPDDGRFDDTMEWVVRQFQTDRGLRVDGIVGNQTWAALRGEEPQAVGTDGELPGTYVEQGIEARWSHEHEAAAFNPNDDQVILVAFNTGSDPLHADNFGAEISLDTGSDRVDVHDYRFVRAADDGPVADAGDLIWILIDNVVSLTNSSSPQELSEMTVYATMSAELGGDIMNTTVGVIT